MLTNLIKFLDPSVWALPTGGPNYNVRTVVRGIDSAN